MRSVITRSLLRRDREAGSQQAVKSLGGKSGDIHCTATARAPQARDAQITIQSAPGATVELPLNRALRARGMMPVRSLAALSSRKSTAESKRLSRGTRMRTDTCKQRRDCHIGANRRQFSDLAGVSGVRYVVRVSTDHGGY